MKKNPLRIGNLTFEYPFVLAPLAGITDRSMRSLCCEAGASLTFTEMVSAKGLWYGDRKTGELLQTGWTGGSGWTGWDAGAELAAGISEGPVGFQLFGREPMILEYAVRLLSDPSHAKAVDAEMAVQLAAWSGDGEEAVEITDSNAAAEAAGAHPADQTEPAVFRMRAPLGARTVCGLRPPALFDLNAGCPVPKIVRNGEGSALLKDPDLLHDCVAAMVRGAKFACDDGHAETGCREGGTQAMQPGVRESGTSGSGPIPVTVKIRKGFEKDDDCAVEIARAAEAAGAAAVTVHGRTRAQFYEGRADWETIAKVKEAVKIPVIGNGDVLSGEDAIRMLRETGCDGVMIARGALGNPWIFAQARALWDGMPLAEALQSSAGSARGQGAPLSPAEAGSGQGYPLHPTDEQRIDQLLRHIDLVCADKGERIAVREMRKHVGWYIRGMRGAAQIRRQINTAGSVSEMRRILGR